MSLSSGTLNLKFMQRAAAKASLSSSNDTTQPNTTTLQTQSEAKSLTSTHAPVAESPSRATLHWILPSRARPVPSSSSSSSAPDLHSTRAQDELGESSTSSSLGRIRFETSYLPFLTHHEQSGSGGQVEHEGSSSRSGGGRISFGGFGFEAQDKEKQEEGEGDQVEPDFQDDEAAQVLNEVENRLKRRTNGFEKVGIYSLIYLIKGYWVDISSSYS